MQLAYPAELLLSILQQSLLVKSCTVKRNQIKAPCRGTGFSVPM